MRSSSRTRLEPLEARLLMSADISYVSASPFQPNNITVSASQSSGAYFLDITGDLIGGPVHQSIAGGETTSDHASATTAYRTTASILDKSVQKGVLHKNTASRYKGRLNARVKALKAA